MRVERKVRYKGCPTCKQPLLFSDLKKAFKGEIDLEGR